MQAGLLWALANAPAFWATNREAPRRAGRQVTGRSITGATMQAIYRCKDGYINFIIYGGAAGRRSNALPFARISSPISAWISDANRTASFATKNEGENSAS